MNTNAIKTYAIQARQNLMQGVKAKLHHWGFDEKGNILEEPAATYGGYTFRGEVYMDETVLPKWEKLKSRMKSSEKLDDIVEEAAYTWFNRLMAIKILEKNGYISPILEFSEGTRTPLIVQNAKKGMHDLTDENDKSQLTDYLQNDQEALAFSLLITRYCNQYPLLKHVFGRIDDYTELLIPSNLLMEGGFLNILNTTEAITDEDYKQVELTGWLYQFYISEKKDEVYKGFKNNKKARPEDIPAATEIFTPKWIVRYMVENTIGKLYLAYEPDSDIKQDMKYLVENPGDKDEDPIISDITELILLDPACGSGHILVTGFELLMKMYREEGYNARQAAESILKNNLFGLDIDLRAMQLARFAILLKAADYYPEILKFPFKGGPEGILPHVYTFPEKTPVTSAEIEEFLGKEGYEYTKELKENLDLLQEGKSIGSALKLKLTEEARDYILKRTRHFIKQPNIVWTKLKSFIEPLLALTKTYKGVAANPPYMGQKNMNGNLKQYVGDNYPKSKGDLFAVFMEVSLRFIETQGLMGMINQHSWMFLSSYEKLRKSILNNYTINSLLHLGPRTFAELSGEVVQSTSFILNNISKENAIANYYRLVEYKTNEEKKNAFLNGLNYYPRMPQTNFTKIPGSPIAYWLSDKAIKIFEKCPSLGEYAKPKQGLSTTNNKRFLRHWSEVNFQKINLSARSRDDTFSNYFKWYPYQKGGGIRKWFGNNEFIINWKNDGAEIHKYIGQKHEALGAPLRGKKFLFKEGITWSSISSSRFSCRYCPTGFAFDAKGPLLVVNDNSLMKYILSFLNSNVANYFFKVLAPTMDFNQGPVGKLPFILNEKYAKKIIELAKTCIEYSKIDWDCHEYSIEFNNNPLINNKDNLKLSFKFWQNTIKFYFQVIHNNEEELNQIFINIYDLKEEIAPDVTFNDIIVFQDEVNVNQIEDAEKEYRETGELTELPIKKDIVMSQLLSYMVGCMMGRYSLDKPGLIMANQGESLNEALQKHEINEQSFPIDEDGIVSFNGSNSYFADDASQRVKAFLIAVWGEDTLTENINFLNECLGMDYEKWLTEKFWEFHCRMYKKTPVYWMFASNPKKPHKAAFKVIAYMHRMNKFTVQNIRNKYLHPYIQWLRDELKNLEKNKDNLNKEQLKRMEKLDEDKKECIEYDDVLKKLANQQIEFDLDDGVKHNIAKFEGAVAEIK